MISFSLKQGLAASLGFGLLLVGSLQTTQAAVSSKAGLSQPRIINGERAEKNRFPFITALVKGDSSAPFCGASFIGKRYVLTASHCVINEHADELAVIIGEYDTQSEDDGQRFEVAQIYLHEDYDHLATNNDVAILELESDVQGVEPVSLLSSELEQQLKAGDILTVAGWGNLNSEAPEYPRYLQQVDLPLYEREACNAAYQGSITEQMLCAGFEQGGKDSCQGDSGGPLLLQRDDKWYQAGVVSFGEGCAVAGSPGVYARVSQFIDWISQKKAGVSYRQTADQGYVEQDYQEVQSLQIKNVGQTAFQVTAIEFANQNGLKDITLKDNQCDGKLLAFEQSCEFQVNLAAEGVSQASTEVWVHTDHPQNNLAKLGIRMRVLDKTALDMPALVGSSNDLVKWYSGGDAAWGAQNRNVVSGGSALESGTITHQQSSVLLAVVSNDRAEQLDFSYLVSSEKDYDGLQLYLNGRVYNGFFFSGTEQTQFEKASIKLQQGTDRIAFIYHKDEVNEDVVGDDRAYLDEISVKLLNHAPKVALQQVNVTVEEQQSITLDASASSDPDGDKLTYRWKIEGDKRDGQLTAGKDGKAQFKAGKKTGTVNYSVTVTDQYGESVSAKGTISITKKPGGGSVSWTLLILLGLSVIGKCRRK